MIQYNSYISFPIALIRQSLRLYFSFIASEMLPSHIVKMH